MTPISVVVPPTSMTAAFLTMSMCEIFHSYNMRSQRGSIFGIKKMNKILNLAMLSSFVLTMTIIYVKPLANVFSLVPLTAPELLTALGCSVAVIPIVEIVKLIQRKVSAR